MSTMNNWKGLRTDKRTKRKNTQTQDVSFKQQKHLPKCINYIKKM